MSRVIRVGGMAKAELLEKLRDAGVQLNEAARTLFADERFTTSEVSALIETVELSVADLGCGSGATLPQIIERAAGAGLSLCPLELAPHLRLQFMDQPEGFLGHPPSQNRAPPGAITVASEPVAQDDETPKGFYLRRIEGVLWLRGYRSWPGHVWSPEDRFVFAQLLPRAARGSRACPTA
ncbi:hypothetical protein [Piscinibacter sp. XHJ-5]|uniref:hypothetical protein n=1 Tax=Piscinibacter sp. XHJ-5 TaxID=3037797 RepID=UPI002452ADF7|nr:hypothetical protein [Piscinibacter sp. XHJ-5]